MYRDTTSTCFRRKEGCEETAGLTDLSSYRPTSYVFPECKSCLTSLTLKAFPYTIETFAYDSNGGFSQIAEWNSFFDNSEIATCPVTQCELMTSDCASPFTSDPNLQIGASQIAIEMKMNVDIG